MLQISKAFVIYLKFIGCLTDLFIRSTLAFIVDFLCPGTAQDSGVTR